METYTILKVDKTINDVPLKNLTFQTRQKKWDGGSVKIRIKNITPSIPLFLSSISFWDVSKYCPVSKNKSHKFTNVPIIPLLIY